MNVNEFLVLLIFVTAIHIAIHIIGFILYSILNKIINNYITNKLGCSIINKMKCGSKFLIFSYYFEVKYIKKNEKYGFFISKKNMILPIYDEVIIHKKFNDMIAVRKDNKWGFIRISDNWKRNIYEAISPQYDTVENFSVLKALVTLNSEHFYIKRNGDRF